MNKKFIIASVAALILAGTTVVGFRGWNSSDKEIDELKAKLSELQRRDKQSAVLYSVSKQMEEIAYEQKKISDEQREEAEEQTQVANEMRQRSEEERQNAIIAQNNALASERKALDAYDMAEQQRLEAEANRRTAEALSYLALGRSLGALAITQFRAGNQEIGDLLSYASYVYTDRYHGDLYYPEIYQALSQSSQSMVDWSRHSDAVYNLEFMSQSDKQLVSVSSDVTIVPNTNTIYAISRNGSLYVKSGKDVKILEMPLVRPFNLHLCKDRKTMFVIGEYNIAKLDLATNTIVGTKNMDFKLVMAARINQLLVLFDDKGRMHIVKDLKDIETRKVPVTGQVTAYVASNDSSLQAYGMKDGTIYLFDQKGNIRKLVGHRSRVSKIRIHENRLFSSSYDGTINLWITNSDKVEPITLFSSSNWILYFNFDRSKNYLWLSDQKGNLSEVLISIPLMVERIKHKLKRDFTQTEWNYYIGEKIPYESFLSEKGKEAKQ